MGRTMLRVGGRCGIRPDRGGRRVRWLCGRGPPSADERCGVLLLEAAGQTATTLVHPILLVMEVVVSNAVADPRVVLVSPVQVERAGRDVTWEGGCGGSSPAWR